MERKEREMVMENKGGMSGVERKEREMVMENKGGM